MKCVMNASVPIDIRSLCDFYTHAILPQFGIKDVEVTWYCSELLTPGDEAIFKFETSGKRYALIFLDNHSGREATDAYDAFIQNNVLTKGQAHSFIPPKSRSSTDRSPAYDGFDLAGFAFYCPYITGTYILVQIIEA
jgi:hypothetical protein